MEGTRHPVQQVPLDETLNYRLDHEIRPNATLKVGADFFCLNYLKHPLPPPYHTHNSVPTLGYLLSTLSILQLKKIWVLGRKVNFFKKNLGDCVTLDEVI
jgi:hypothetical protein